LLLAFQLEREKWESGGQRERIVRIRNEWNFK
jgi:hypothetical protein